MLGEGHLQRRQDQLVCRGMQTMRQLAHEVQAYMRLFMHELEKRLLIDLDDFRLLHSAYGGIALRPSEQTQLASVLTQCLMSQ